MNNNELFDIIQDIRHNYSDDKFETLNESLSDSQQEDLYSFLFNFKSELKDIISHAYNKIKYLNQLSEDDKNIILNDLDHQPISRNLLESMNDYLQEHYQNYTFEMALTHMQAVIDSFCDRLIQYLERY